MAIHDPLSLRLARSVMSYYKPEMVSWHYEHGLVLQAVWNAGKQHRENSLCAWAKSMLDTQIAADGTIKGYNAAALRLDDINAGKLLFPLYQETGDERYRKAFETLRCQLDEQPRTEIGAFWHKKGYPSQVWLDGLYMQGPFFAQYAAEYAEGQNRNDAFEDIVLRQFVAAYIKTVDSETGLLRHAWDESRSQAWADRDTGQSPHVWGRAMGWYCMAVLDVLDFLPASLDLYRKKLIEIADNLRKPILNFQDSGGLWYQVTDHPGGQGNYLESSSSAMFAYFLLKGARLGYFGTGVRAVTAMGHEVEIDADAKATVAVAAKKIAADAKASAAKAAKAAAVKALEALEAQKITVDKEGVLHLADTCGGCGLGKVPDSPGPYRDGSFHYYVTEKICADDFKGVGPLILAALENERED